jgi:cytidyltransferase-like protein
MRLSIFGGTFDPIHDGHLAVASQAAAELRLDRVWIVPAAHPPHKSGATGAGYEDRVRLAELACAAEERFFVSRIEQGGGRNYSIDTIEKVRATLAPSDELPRSAPGSAGGTWRGRFGFWSSAVRATATTCRPKRAWSASTAWTSISLLRRSAAPWPPESGRPACPMRFGNISRSIGSTA